jgi:hypothetical protein
MKNEESLLIKPTRKSKVTLYYISPLSFYVRDELSYESYKEMGNGIYIFEKNE